MKALDFFTVVLSLPERNDRRVALEPRLREAGFVNWTYVVPPDTKRMKRGRRGFNTLGRRSCALGKRLALRLARRQFKPLLLLEDDAVFAPDFIQRLASLELPSDWAFFYLGCCHYAPPELVSSGLLRAHRAVDNHALPSTHRITGSHESH